MAGRSRKRIYVCEKKPRFRAMLENALGAEAVSVSGFSSHQECLETLGTQPCDLLIVDLEGCESEGLDLFEQARRIAPWISSLAIVEHAAVPCAIRAIRAGAGDCLDKPVPPERLVAEVQVRLACVHASACRRPRALTRMEVQILQMILAGMTSYDIAAEMRRSKRTVDVHRKNIMRKLQATCLVDLIKRALGMGFAGSPDPPEEEPGRQGETRE